MKRIFLHLVLLHLYLFLITIISNQHHGASLYLPSCRTIPTISAHLSCYAQFLSIPFPQTRIHKPSIPRGIWIWHCSLDSASGTHTDKPFPSHGCSRCRGRSRSPGPRWWRNWRKRCRCIYPFPWKLHRPSPRLRIARKEGKEKEGRAKGNSLFR